MKTESTEQITAPQGVACTDGLGDAMARKAKTLRDLDSSSETRWAATLTDAELADELIANLWADIPWREKKKCALLYAAIDRLKTKSPNDQAHTRRANPKE